ncbi:hypothetical protein RF11_05796 [Thelohanellus kitauei]|uniref:Uncharacterized protein n=1 Tax=Thelohanellus kitauei TaxID=669202 RepID=A0A0C2M9T7_THEKT|nr:hypothetical protein RF11_05796 [Thelohanellus kitauei]
MKFACVPRFNFRSIRKMAIESRKTAINIFANNYDIPIYVSFPGGPIQHKNRLVKKYSMHQLKSKLGSTLQEVANECFEKHLIGMMAISNKDKNVMNQIFMPLLFNNLVEKFIDDGFRLIFHPVRLISAPEVYDGTSTGEVDQVSVCFKIEQCLEVRNSSNFCVDTAQLEPRVFDECIVFSRMESIQNKEWMISGRIDKKTEVTNEIQ